MGKAIGALIIGTICTFLFWIIVPIILVLIPIIFYVGTFLVSVLGAYMLLSVIMAAMAVEDEKPEETKKDPLH